MLPRKWGWAQILQRGREKRKNWPTRRMTWRGNFTPIPVHLYALISTAMGKLKLSESFRQGGDMGRNYFMFNVNTVLVKLSCRRFPASRKCRLHFSLVSYQKIVSTSTNILLVKKGILSERHMRACLWKAKYWTDSKKKNWN